MADDNDSYPQDASMKDSKIDLTIESSCSPCP